MRLMTTPRTAKQYVDALAARGVRLFSGQEACQALGGSAASARAALRRLKKRGELATPHRGYYLIVPPEHRRLGSLPAAQFIPELMGRLGLPYYVALLSAAEIHGAAHQRPQAFQVMLPSGRRPLSSGEVRVEFVSRADAEETSVVEHPTEGIPLRVASPEATALELVGYADRAAGWNNVATVLGELAEAVSPDSLAQEAARSPIAWVQRLGFLLEQQGVDSLLSPLASEVERRARSVAPLVPGHAVRVGSIDPRWRLQINAHVEPDA